MKKIVNVNIGGVPFTLDEDAYQLLSQYLDTLHALYHDDDDDMVSDIEARIAELLLENVAEGRIVTLADIQREIAVIGDPHDFDAAAADEEEAIEIDITRESGAQTAPASGSDRHASANSAEATSATTPPDFNCDAPVPPRIDHKLYRDPRNKMIAGVCSGIAAYNHMSVNTVRILTVAAFFLTLIFPLGALVSGWLVPIIYACFWIAVPEAQTPLQFMELYGRETSMADVAEAVNKHYTQPDGRPAPSESASGFWTNLSRIILAIVKGFFAFLAIVIGVPLIIALIVALIVFIVVAIAELFAGTSAMPMLAQFWAVVPAHANFGIMLMLLISSLCLLLIPAWFLLRSIFNWESRFPLTRGSRIIWLVLWIISIVLTCIGVAAIA